MNIRTTAVVPFFIIFFLKFFIFWRRELFIGHLLLVF
jgi:hypothetical protein